MPEQALSREKKPSKNEVTSLGQRAVALLGERGPSEVSSVFDDPIYGGLETHVAFFALEEGLIVRVGTMQDWEGQEPRPAAHVVVMEPNMDDHTDIGEMVVKETTYDFSRGGLLGYSVDVLEAVVVYDPRGLPIQKVHTAGWVALRDFFIPTDMPRKERKVLKEALRIDFDRERYSRLSQLVAACGPHNRIELVTEGNPDDAE